MTHKVILQALLIQLLTLATGIKEVLTLATGFMNQKLLSNRTIPVVVPAMNPRINQRIAPTVLVPQVLLTPTTKKVVADATLVDAWVNRDPRQVSWTKVNRSTTSNICNDFSVNHALYTVPIGVVTNYAPCGLDISLKVANKWQSISPALARNTPNWTLLLKETCLMIWILRPFSER